jgi:hypothetical protein
MDKSDKVHPSIDHKTEDNPLVSHFGLKQIFKNELTLSSANFIQIFFDDELFVFSCYTISKKIKEKSRKTSFLEN